MLTPENNSKLRDLIGAYDLLPFAEQIVAESEECATLVRGEPIEDAPIGGSRYGGLPDLPPDFAWPRNAAGDYLCFLMQIALSDLPPSLYGEEGLPALGMLYLFIGEDEATTEVEHSVVYLDSAPDALQCTERPNGEPANEDYDDLVPHRVLIRGGISVPGYGSPLQEAISEEDDEAADRLHELSREASGAGNREPVIGQVRGVPGYLFGDLRENAHLNAIGEKQRIYDVAWRREHATEITQGAQDWVLLWRVHSDHAVGVEIWDAGMLNLLIRRDDLQRRDFSQVWAEIETS